MRRRLSLFLTLIILILVLARPEKVLAACSPPGDYRDCPSSAYGTNGVALMDSQYNPIETNFANLRQLATQSNPATVNQRLQATIILTDGTIADQNKTLAIFNNAEKYGIDLTIRTWGNEMSTDVASEMGKNLSAEVAAYQKASGQTIRVELGNEPNLDVNGNDYAYEFAAFAKNCSACQIYLPSMGGTDLGNKQQFINEFMSNPEAAALAAKASGIVFNSYASTPQAAVTDWVNTLNFWLAKGVNTSNMSYFLTETGPPGGDVNWPNLNDFLSGVAAEYERIKNDPTDPNYQAFNKLEGLTFFVWTKDEKLVLVYVDKNGKVTTKTSLPSANVPGAITVTKKNVTTSGVSSFVKYPDESEEPCPYNEGALNQQNPSKPYMYRPPNGASPTPEMRGDANLNFNIGVKGTHCGQAKSTPINLEEVAPYNLLQTPLCKEVGWAGEIQMNYRAPPDVDLRIPFAEQMADQLAGSWDPEHVNECRMDNTERTARGLPTQACTLPGQGAGSSGNQPKFIVPADVSKNPEYNIAVRGERAVSEPDSLVTYGYEEAPDPQAPQLNGILGTDPTQPGAFVGTYRVQDPGGGDSPPWKVSELGLSATPGQTVNTPGGAHDIGGGNRWMLVYADSGGKATLVNGTDDDPTGLYAVTLSGVAVNPSLLAQYNAANAAGRRGLPLLGGTQAIGTAIGSEVKTTIRDSGQFMDPRSKLDWWQNYAGAAAPGEKPFTNVGVTHYGAPTLAAQTEASETIERKRGFLKKILAPEVQDKLKCDFITYVKKQGANSMYADFTVDGTRLAAIPCPPTAPQIRNYNTAAYDTWYVRWGKTWKRLALFPNERATGKLSFMVCDDRNYYLNQAYPEVMRMGLAANQIFKLFTPKTGQDAFYGQPDYGDLRDPLNSRKLIGESAGGQKLSFAPKKLLANTGTAILAGADTFVKSEQHWVSGGIAALTGQIGNAARGITRKFLAMAGAGKLLVQATGQLTVDLKTTVVDGQSNYQVVISSPVFGHVITELWIDNQKSGIGTVNLILPGGQLIYGTPGRAPDGSEIFPVLTGDHTIQVLVKCDDCNIPGQQGQEIWRSCTVEGGQTTCAQTGPVGSPPAACDPAVQACQCRETLTCPYSDPTSRAQLGPSDTEVWQYYKNHNLIGVDWKAFNAGLSDEATPRFVKLDWQIPAWHAGKRSSRGKPLPECSIEVPSKAENRQACSGPADDAACGAPGNACNEIKGFCGTIMCTKVHERVVDVYNNVPFLASAWQQLAGVSSVATGVFNTWKAALNPSIEGNSQTLISGCSDNPNIVFDKSGNFVPNPGASEMYFSWDQHFGFAGENLAFGDFGKSQVTVTMTKPKDGKAKILFYRLGGLCNALKWLTNNNLLPLGIKNPAILGTAGASVGAPLPSTVSGPATGTGFSGLTPAPATTPAPLPTNTIQSVPPAQVNNVVNQVAATVPTLPKTETPTISTVINAGNLTNQPAFASVQNGDQILVYPTSQQVYVYRPATKQIIAQMPTINFSVRNGGGSSFGYETFINNLKQLIPNAVILDRNDAQRKDYAHSFIVDLSGNNQAATQNLAILLKIKVDKLPTGESKLQQSAYLIIVGSDQTTP